MKKLMIINLMIAMIMVNVNLKAQNATNDFYDDAETFELKGTQIIELAGEIGNPGSVDITEFPLRSLIIKEAVLSGDTNKFVGAYRYDGYSIYDILNHVVLKKKNEAEFPPIIDLFVKIENAEGESVVFSWGELYYPVHRHEIIIATQVARIVPSKTKDLWPLPEDVKLVAGHDLVTDRNLSNPVKITVMSADASYEINRELSPLFSPSIRIVEQDKLIDEIHNVSDKDGVHTYESVFYGRGRGIHSTSPFTGAMLKEVLRPFFTFNRKTLREGYFIIAAADGYRCVFTFSEIFNRNDQAEVLLIEDPKNTDGGAFRLFPAGDFFSDRAIKAVSEIRFVGN
jgi:hypothetical protein